MTDKKKLHQILSSLWKNDDSVGKTYYNQALQDVQTAVDLQEEPLSEELEKVVEEIVDPTVLNAYGVKEIANRLRRTMIEPVSKELEEACEQLAENARKHKAETSSPFFSQTDYRQGVVDGAKWQKAKDESTTEDLGEYINELSKQFPEVSFAKLSRIAVRVAKWQKEHLWKPADGDSLPEYDREVIVLTQSYPLEGSEFAVSFAHRPDPKGWDGKSITTGKVEHYTPKTYGKGGWNILNVKYWLDIELPKEIEL